MPGETYCEEDDKYPTEKIELLISRMDNKSIIEGFLNHIDSEPFSVEISPKNGMGDQVKIEICPSITKIIFPKTARSVDDELLHIYNVDKFKQGILTERCM